MRRGRSQRYSGIDKLQPRTRSSQPERLVGSASWRRETKLHEQVMGRIVGVSKLETGNFLIVICRIMKKINNFAFL